MDDPGAFIKIMARKIGDDPKLLRKNLDKAQKLLTEVETMTARSKQETLPGKTDLFVFGLPLEMLKTAPALIEYGSRLYPVVIPEFIFLLGKKLMDCDCTTGLFRIPPNAKRVDAAMESIEAGQSLNDIANLHGHDYCGLLKLWARELPSPILPDIISGYFLRVFERLSTGKLSKEEACQILMYLGRYVPQRHRETMAFLSYIMSNIARDSDTNGMNARNLAICCPTLFISTYTQRCLDGRQFQAMMYLMEFFIINPHAFLPMETAATVITEETATWVTLRKGSPLPQLEFPSAHVPLHPELATALLPSSFQRMGKKAGHGYVTPLRTQPLRGLGKVAVDLKNKMGRIGMPSCLKPGSEDGKGEGVSVCDTPDVLRTSPSTGVFPLPNEFPEELSAMVTPPRDQFRGGAGGGVGLGAGRRRSGILSHRSCENIDRLSPSSHSAYPVPLDFEDVIELLTPSTSARPHEPHTPHSGMQTPHSGMQTPHSGMQTSHSGKTFPVSDSLDVHSDMMKELASTSFTELSFPSGPSR